MRYIKKFESNNFSDNIYGKYLDEDKNEFDEFTKLNPAVDIMWRPLSKIEFFNKIEIDIKFKEHWKHLL